MSSEKITLEKLHPFELDRLLYILKLPEQDSSEKTIALIRDNLTCEENIAISYIQAYSLKYWLFFLIKIFIAFIISIILSLFGFTLLKTFYFLFGILIITMPVPPAVIIRYVGFTYAKPVMVVLGLLTMTLSVL